MRLAPINEWADFIWRLYASVGASAFVSLYKKFNEKRKLSRAAVVVKGF